MAKTLKQEEHDHKQEQKRQETALLAYQEKSQELARIERDHKHELRIRGFILQMLIVTVSIVVCTIIVFALVSLLLWGDKTKWQLVYDSLLEMLSYIWTAVGSGAIGLIFGVRMKR